MVSITSPGKRNTFSGFLKKVDTEKVSGLKKKILDYIIEKAKFKHIHKLSKKSLEDIEEEVEDLVDETVDINLDSIKKNDLEKMKIHEHVHFDKYEVPEDNDEIEILKDLPKQHVHFDRYESPK